MLHKMKLNKDPFNRMKNGTKKIEFRLFDEKKKPILGICAGLQEINVIFGGSLFQKISNHNFRDGKTEQQVIEEVVQDLTASQELVSPKAPLLITLLVHLSRR